MNIPIISDWWQKFAVGNPTPAVVINHEHSETKHEHEITNKFALSKHILHTFIIPALIELGLNSRSAQELVLGTGIQESGLKATRQHGGGPALGLFQMEPNTYNDIWDNFIAYHPDIHKALLKMVGGHKPHADRMVFDTKFAAAMCRVHYNRIHHPLPDMGDVNGHAEYWKKYYNTVKGAGKPSEYIRNWHTHVNHTTFLED